MHLHTLYGRIIQALVDYVVPFNIQLRYSVISLLHVGLPLLNNIRLIK